MTRTAWWTPPNFAHYKIIFDGALFDELGAPGLGVVLRDSYGCAIGALSERIAMPISAATVEALAFWRALIFSKELSIFELIMEADAEVITKALLAEDVSHPEFGLVLNDVLVLAAEFRFL